MKRAILVVSFGTSYEDTRRRTIDRIEADIAAAYPDCRVYRAWTSGMIRAKLQKRDGIVIPDVRGALEMMAADGVREAIVQPTHVINGYENDSMEEDVASMKDRFEKVVVGAPLLNSQEDNSRVIHAIVSGLHPGEGEVIVLMGHGTEHYANAVYAALDYQFKDLGYHQFYMGTVEGYPALDSVLRMVKSSGAKRAVLAPFMIVAGDHASNDLAGDGEDSWKSAFLREGFEVRCVLKGLGEYQEIRELFLAHTAEAVRKLDLQ